MFREGQIVEVLDKERIKNDPFLDAEALGIIETENFKGKITKIEDEIHFVGFKNSKGWVTQGYKFNEIKGVE